MKTIPESTNDENKGNEKELDKVYEENILEIYPNGIVQNEMGDFKGRDDSNSTHIKRCPGCSSMNE